MSIEIKVGATDIRWLVFALIATLASSWLVRGRVMHNFDVAEPVAADQA